MVFTLLAVGAAMVVVTYIGHRSSYYLPFSKMVLEREKAKTLALSGVQIAIAQLAQAPQASASAKASPDALSDKDTGPDKNTAAAKKASPEKEFLTRILPTLNRWQHFDLTEKNDGVEGKISICLMCEEGKINLNRIIDFKKNAFQGGEKSGWKVVMQEACKAIERIAKGGDLFPAFEKIVKEAKFPSNFKAHVPKNGKCY